MAALFPQLPAKTASQAPQKRLLPVAGRPKHKTKKIGTEYFKISDQWLEVGRFHTVWVVFIGDYAKEFFLSLNLWKQKECFRSPMCGRKRFFKKV